METNHPERDLSNYIWRFFYYNPKDRRVFVPKFNPDYGIQLNFGNTKSYLALLAMIFFFGFVIYMIEKNRVN
jgi:uncharacterized membrane protein